ncbi:MAG: outer membrane beta-barrel protein, partial [Pseudomonadota bacterium]
MTTRKATKKLCAGAAALAVGVSSMAVMSVGAATSASAQDLTRGQGVLQRRRVENEQQGIRAGGFNVYPTIAVGGEYNDNIFARADNELDALGNPNPIEDDFIYITAPEVEVESTWSRHQLRARAFTEDRRNLDFTGESNTDWGGDASFRLDVRRNTQVSVDALYDSIVEGRISSGLQDDTTFRPQIERYGGGVQVSQVINRVRGT